MFSASEISDLEKKVLRYRRKRSLLFAGLISILSVVFVGTSILLYFNNSSNEITKDTQQEVDKKNINMPISIEDNKTSIFI